MKAVKSYCLLKAIKNADAKKRRQLHSLFGDQLVDAVCECAYNVMKNKVKVKTTTRKKLVKYHPHLLALSTKKTPRQVKKKIILQTGGALFPLLIPPVLGVLSSVIGDLISKRVNGHD